MMALLNNCDLNSDGDFLRRAHQRLLIYDPEISDKEMLRILNDQRKSGLEIRVIGEVDSGAHLSVVRLAKMRLHTRTIIRDDREAFLGSQSLRAAELDSRREVGLIVRQPEVVRRLVQTFESDWESRDRVRTVFKASEEPKLDTEKIERVLVEELHPIAATVKKAVNKVVQRAGEEALEDQMVKDTVKKVVKDAVKQAVKTASENNGKS
jgi:PLD-like domain